MKQGIIDYIKTCFCKHDYLIDTGFAEIEVFKNKGIFIIHYLYDFDKLWNVNGLVYSNGKWATPLNENKEIQDKIDSLQKQLDELKQKVK